MASNLVMPESLLRLPHQRHENNFLILFTSHQLYSTIKITSFRLHFSGDFLFCCSRLRLKSLWLIKFRSSSSRQRIFAANTKYLCRTSPKWSSKKSKYFQCIFLRHVHFEMHKTYFYQFLLRSIWIWFRLCVIFRRRLPFEICSDSIKILENIARKTAQTRNEKIIRKLCSERSLQSHLISYKIN